MSSYRRRVGAYLGVREPDHPRANSKGFVLEHILVAERALGKYLPPGVEVHHVNGNTHDNRPQNLVICQDHAYHWLLHVRQRALEACGNPNWRKCAHCKTYDAPENMYVNGSTAWHTPCQTAYARRLRARKAT